MQKWVLAGILFFGGLLNAQSVPWLTGPLLAPKGAAVPYGDFVVKSYLYAITNTGSYNQDRQVVSADENFYSLKAQFLSFFGLTPWCDLNIIPEVVYNITSTEQDGYPGDLTVGLDFQLMEPDLTPYFPGIKLAVREVFPTGRFEYLRPRKLSTDLTGWGTFATQFDLIFYKVFSLYSRHFLSMTLSAEYTVNTPVDVHGFNAYGGGFGAKGKALPGNRFQGVASFEITLNRNWVFALDTLYTYTNGTPFFGNPGINFDGEFASVGKPSSENLSFAPAIEYNFSKHLGIIGGCWFSAFGRNSAQFRSGVINVQYAY